MPTIGFPELLLIFVIIIVLFGASRLPQLGAGLGKGIRNFKAGLKAKDDQDALPENPKEDK